MAEVSIEIETFTVRQQWQPCIACRGRGVRIENGKSKSCPWCQGQGRVERPIRFRRMMVLVDGR